MRVKLHFDTREERCVRTARTRGMMVGLVGGLVGTIVMDLFGGVLFVVIGGPASPSWSSAMPQRLPGYAWRIYSATLNVLR